VSVPWWFLGMSGTKDNPLTEWMEKRLGQLENVLKEREWLAAGRFTAADLLMADVLRVSKVRAFGDRPATESLCDPNDRSPRVSESPRRSARALRGGGREQSGCRSIIDHVVEFSKVVGAQYR
jgi:glutathione S-transferase